MRLRNTDQCDVTVLVRVSFQPQGKEAKGVYIWRWDRMRFLYICSPRYIWMCLLPTSFSGSVLVDVCLCVMDECLHICGSHQWRCRGRAFKIPSSLCCNVMKQRLSLSSRSPFCLDWLAPLSAIFPALLDTFEFKENRAFTISSDLDYIKSYKVESLLHWQLVINDWLCLSYRAFKRTESMRL